MNTKDSILNESLKLFAQKGYDGVSVREIASEVGVRESALYKHYRNKEDILESIIAVMKERIHEAYVNYKVPETVNKDIAKGYMGMSEKQVCDLAWKIFEMFTKDSMNSNFRKLLMREQFNNKKLADCYNEFFIDGVLKSQSKTFKALVKSEMFIKEDEKIKVLQFYGPIQLMFQMYDYDPEQEKKIKSMFYKHVKSFGNYYVRKTE